MYLTEQNSLYRNIEGAPIARRLFFVMLIG